MSFSNSAPPRTTASAAKPTLPGGLRRPCSPPNAPTAPDRRPGASANPLGIFLALLLLLLGISCLVGEGLSRGADYLVVLGPLGLVVVCMWTAYRVVATNPLNLWTPIPWFLAACAVYFGVGPLIYTFGSPATIAEMSALWAVSAEDLWRTNMLNLCGILVITITILLVEKLASRAGGSPAASVLPEQGQSAVWIAALTFLVIGVPIKYFLVVPYHFGLLGYPVPTVVAVLEDFDPLGMLMLSYMAARYGKGWTAILLILLGLEMAVELVRFNKHSLLLMLAMVALGRHMVKRRLGELALAGGILFAIYLLVAPLVTMGRQEITRRHGNHYGAPLGERFEIVGNILTSPGSDGAEAAEANQNWWSRLCYAHAEAFAMHSYDNGSPGDSFDMLAYVLVPRLLDPDKPIMTDAGYDFSELAYGHRHTLTGIGIFGEAYWNGGWPMVVLASVYIGLLFAVFSALTRRMMSSRNWPFFMPCVLFSIRFGYRIDGWFVGDYVGQAPIFVAILILSCFIAIAFRPLVAEGRSPRERVGLA